MPKEGKRERMPVDLTHNVSKGRHTVLLISSCLVSCLIILFAFSSFLSSLSCQRSSLFAFVFLRCVRAFTTHRGGGAALESIDIVSASAFLALHRCYTKVFSLLFRYGSHHTHRACLHEARQKEGVKLKMGSRDRREREKQKNGRTETETSEHRAIPFTHLLSDFTTHT